MPRKHTMPEFLNGSVLPEAYERWLGRKAMAHVRRDRKRGHSAVTRALYKEAIHAAVVVSDGRSYPRPDEHRNEILRPAAQQQRYITRGQLLQICRWKAPRAVSKAEPNDDGYVRDLTAISFSTSNEPPSDRDVDIA